MDSESKYRGLNSSMMWMNGCSSLFSLSRSHLLIPSFFTRLRPTDTTQSIKETSNRLTRSLTPLLTALLRPTPIFIHYQAHCLILPAPNSSLNLMGSHLHSTCTETFSILVIQGYPLIRALKRQIEDERFEKIRQVCASECILIGCLLVGGMMKTV